MTNTMDFATILDRLPRANLERIAAMTGPEIREWVRQPGNPYDEGFYRAACQRLREIEGAERIDELPASGDVCRTCRDEVHALCRECERGRLLMSVVTARKTTEAIAKMLDSAGVPPRFREHTFASFPGDPAAAAAVEAFVSGWDKEKNLVLSGPVGVGKSGLVAAALDALIPNLLETECMSVAAIDDPFAVRVRRASGRSIEFITAIGLANRLRNGYNDGTFAETMKRMQSAWLLIVDDVGVERPTDWTREQVTSIIDARYGANLPTWITTNLTPAELVEHLEARSTSRLFEHSEVVHVKGDDLRFHAGCSVRPRGRHNSDRDDLVTTSGGAGEPDY